MSRRLVVHLMITALIIGCSVKGKDVLLQVKEIQAKRDFYSYDGDYMRKTKELREKNPDSVLAHIAYINARRDMKSIQVEYQELLNKNPDSDFFKYLKLRADFMALSRIDLQKKNEIIEKLEKLPITSASDEFKYDLAKILTDKLEVSKLAGELYKKRPDYGPYQELYASTLKANDNSSEMLDLCKSGLSSQPINQDLCTNIFTINDESLLSERNALIKDLVEKSIHSNDELLWRRSFYLVKNINDSKEKDALSDELVKGILKKNPNWLPHPFYRHYYGNISFGEYKLLERLSDIGRIPNFDERIKAYNTILNDQNSSELIKEEAYTSLGFEYLNPANKDENKAYDNLFKAFQLNPEGDGVGQLVSLILELNKDPNIGLEVLAKSEEGKLKREINNIGFRSNDLSFFSDQLKFVTVSYPTLRGQLLLKLGKFQEARVEFLKAYHIKESEFLAFHLGKVYQDINPNLAMEFYILSLKHRDESSPMEEDLSKERDENLLRLQRNIFVDKIDQKTLLTFYKDNVEKEEKEGEHPFINKDLVTMEMEDFKGGKYDWNKTKGQNVILSFWATWCTPCFQEMAVLNKIQKEGKIPNLKIIGVCTDGLSQKRKVSKIIKDGGIEFDIVLGDGTLRDKYFVSAIPSMFFANKENKITKFKMGYSPKLEDEIFKIFN